jgi:hypothetical protein
LKERMIFSPNRSHFGGSCARNREHSVIQSVCQIPEQNARNRASCPSVNSERGHAEDCLVCGSGESILSSPSPLGRLSLWAAGPVVGGLLVSVD